MRNRDRESGPVKRYCIEVKGHLQGDWTEWFGGLAITNLPNGNTLIVGPVVDQAALHGLINKVFALGLSLVALSREVGQR